MQFAEAGGYWMADAGGNVHAFGKSQHHGDLGASGIADTVVDLAPHPDGNGYWLLVENGRVFGFGSATVHDIPSTPTVEALHPGGLDRFGCHGGSQPRHCHNGTTSTTSTTTTTTSTTTTSTTAAPLPPTTCNDIRHRVYAGDPEFHAGLDRDRDGVGCEAWPEKSAPGFVPPERWTTMSPHPSGDGYWAFSNQGRVAAYGVARSFGDLTHVVLDGPIVDAVATPSGNGYYLLGGDGGVFAFGDARFQGSMGGIALDEPAVGLVPDPDGTGYWLVAGDGGVFAFAAPFVGSIPGVLPPGARLNQPINGMVPYGNGYLMVAYDGGVFNFATDLGFLGSLGDNPPADEVIAVAAKPPGDSSATAGEPAPTTAPATTRPTTTTSVPTTTAAPATSAPPVTTSTTTSMPVATTSTSTSTTTSTTTTSTTTTLPSKIVVSNISVSAIGREASIEFRTNVPTQVSYRISDFWGHHTAHQSTGFSARSWTQHRFNAETQHEDLIVGLPYDVTVELRAGHLTASFTRELESPPLATPPGPAWLQCVSWDWEPDTTAGSIGLVVTPGGWYPPIMAGWDHGPCHNNGPDPFSLHRQGQQPTAEDICVGWRPEVWAGPVAWVGGDCVVQP